MFATPLTSIHVVLSLVAIAAGYGVLAGFLSDRHRSGLAATFVASTALMLLTGFLLPFSGITPAVAVGIVASAALALAAFALYAREMRGPWRAVWVAGAAVSVWLNSFVLVVQLFQKVPVLNAFAPTGSEPPFAIVQGLVLLIIVAAGALSLRRFRPRVH